MLAPVQPGQIALLGVPLDHNSSFLRGSVLAPRRLRETLYSDSSSLNTEGGINLGAGAHWVDAGDLVLGNPATDFAIIERATGELIDQGARVLAIGGDHSITFPLVAAHAKRYPGLTILHFDAHTDLYDEYEGKRTSHACPFARIMEAGLAKRLVQVGIRSLNAHTRAQAQRFGVEIVEMRRWTPAALQSLPPLAGPLYLSLDLDVLDPAFAPGVSHHEPGGLSTRELVRMIQQIEAPIAGADLVELNPVRDLTGATAMVAAFLLKELAGQLLATPRPVPLRPVPILRN